MKIAIACILSLAALPLMAADTTPAPATEPDNSAVNKRDRDDTTKTPEDQGAVKHIAAVRRAITKDDTLSINAHNVKIIIDGGVVTLRGPVKDEAEKTKVADIVSKVDGVTKVDNQLEITAK